MTSHTILVVEDNPITRKMLRFALETEGYYVVDVADGRAALEASAASRPDLLVLDYVLPDTEGLRLLAEVRRRTAAPELPAVVVTGMVSRLQELRAESGASIQFLVKPVEPSQLLEVVRAQLSPPEGRERLQVQLERQAARNEVLVPQATIQNTALSIIRGLSELLAQPKDATQILADVLVHCLDAAGLSTGLLYFVEPGGNHRLQAQFGVPVGSKTDAEAAFGHPELLGRIVEARQPVALSSREEEASAEARDFLARLGHSSALILPFIVLGETFGELVLASDGHDLSESAWIGFARSLALQFGQTLALGQSLKRAAASEGRYRALMEEANDAILILEPGHKVLEANFRAEQVLGRPRAEIVGRHYDEFVVPDEQADSARRQEQLLADGALRVERRQLMRADGTSVSVEVSASVVRLGEESAVFTILRDITERKRVEQEIAERMELAAFTSAIGAALIRDEPLRVVLQQCAEAMMRHLEPAFARIWTLNRAGDTLELQASAGMYTHLDGAHARVPVGHFKIGLIAAKREPHVTNDVIHDPRVSDPAWARCEGMVAFAGYPLVVGDQLVGVMAMFSRHPLSSNVLSSMAAVAIQIALGIKRKLSEEEHRATEEQYRLLFENNPHPMWVYNQETYAFLAVNDASVRHYGYLREEFLAMTVKDLRAPEEVRASRHATKHRKKEGGVIEVEVAASPIVFRGQPAWLALVSDVTEKRSLEAQLLQSQKMESMGRLAGGISHDFNNLLGIITGYADLLRQRVSADPRLTKYVEDIVKAAERAAGLTHQLLAFSGKQMLQPRILDLNVVVRETEKPLRRVIGEDVQLVMVCDDHLGAVRADPGQMDQVLMNLAANARDAMPRGGRLTIETRNVVLDLKDAGRHAGVEPGRYVMLAVSDTGHGMSLEVQARVFEPFFTTKEAGKGTGLGLATVHGIVKQSGGHIWFYSEPGQGTTFKIYLPRAGRPAVAGDVAPSAEGAQPRGSETVLLVEDDVSLRDIIRDCLEAAGYTVLEARHGVEALEICERHAAPIHLLVTDVVMPVMSGQDLAEKVRASRPEIRVLYMSGYTEDAVVLHGVLAAGVGFLQKPFTAEALVRRVREVLNAPTGGAG